MEMADRLDHVVIFSGDGDFRCLVEATQRKGVRVTVVSTVKSSPPMVADELRRQADNFIEMQDIADQIARTHAPRDTGEDVDEAMEMAEDEDEDEPAYDLAT
jgi:uncharacterized LabA/DUF88 family protein